MPLLTRTESPADAVPAAPTLADFPDFVAADAKLSELQAQHSAAVRAQTDVEARYIAACQPGTNKMTDAALGLIASGEFPVTSRARELGDAYDVARRETAILARAIALQERIVEQLRLTVSHAICASAPVRGEFHAKAARLIAAALELSRADQAVEDFRTGLEHAGVRPILPGLRISSLGRITQQDSQIRYRLRDFAAAGVPLPAIPELEGGNL